MIGRDGVACRSGKRHKQQTAGARVPAMTILCGSARYRPASMRLHVHAFLNVKFTEGFCPALIGLERVPVPCTDTLERPSSRVPTKLQLPERSPLVCVMVMLNVAFKAMPWESPSNAPA